MTRAQTDLKEHFLDPEIRCGFMVDSRRKRLWAVQLEMLQSVLTICRERNLKIWMAGGSLLGAMRHRGYIPWDDDIDLMMPRKDYDRFCGIAQSSLPADCFLQTQYTDPSFHIPMAKIRKNGTSAIESNEITWGLPFHKGIFIDIFPLDAFPDDKALISKAFSKMFSLSRVRRIAQTPNWKFCESHPSLRDKFRRFKYSPFRLRLFNWYLTHRVESLFTKYSARTDIPYMLCLGWWCMFSGGNTDCHKFTYPQELFQETTLVPFEYIDVPVPAQATRLLEIQFGNWREFVRGSACHAALDISIDEDWRVRSTERYGYAPSAAYP